MKKYSWTQPQCDECYMRDNPGRQPIVLKEPDTEKCVSCGIQTRSGVYIRIDPEFAKYPSLTKDEA